MRSLGLAVLLGCLLAARAPRAAAAPPEPPAPAPPTPVEAAAEVRKAVEAQDGAGLRALALRDEPDPWLVVEALLVQDARAAADAFARAAPRKDVEALPAFVAETSVAEADAKGRQAVADANAALQERRFEDALRLFGTVPAEARAFLRARATFGKGLALAGLGKPAEAAEQFASASQELEALGWFARAAAALKECARNGMEASNPVGALEALGRLARLEGLRGDPKAQARAWNAIGSLHGQSGAWEEAVRAHTRALDVLRERQERALMAETFNAIGWAEVHRGGRTQEAHAAVERARGISELMGLSAVTARSHEIQAMAYQAEGRLDLAEIAAGDAVEAARPAGDAALLARLLHLRGLARCDLDDFARALEPLAEALRGAEALDPKSGAAVTLSRARYAWALAQAGKAAEARPLAERAVTDAAPLTRFLQGIAHWALGAVLAAEGKGEEAVKALMVAGAHLEAVHEFDDSLRVVLAVAEVRRAEGKLPEARVASDTALEGARRFPKGLALPAALTMAARVRLAQGEAKEALPLAKEARTTYQSRRHAKGREAAEALVREIEAALAK